MTKPSAPPASAPVARGPKLWIILAVLAVGILSLLAGVIWSTPLRLGLLRLIVIAGELRHGPSATSTTPTAAASYYTCGMHPWVILPKPGLCPICHMDLVPLDPEKFSTEIAIDPTVTQNIGVRTAPVIVGDLRRTIRTVGVVTYDANRLTDISVRTMGYVEQLPAADLLDRFIRQGQVLAEFHSPEIITVGQELLGALRISPADPMLIDAARSRLRILGVPEALVTAWEKAGAIPRTFQLVAPRDGFLKSLERRQGEALNTGETLARLADLSEVWVMLTLYEHQLPLVRVGQTVKLSLSYEPGRTYEGRIASIDPALNPETRQARARVVVANPDPAQPALKPGMYVTGEIDIPVATQRTLVPREAVIDTGNRQVALVVREAGRFEPRPVRLGREDAQGNVEILEGLKPGETVVVSGQFLLDSESRVREALAKMIAPAPRLPAGANEDQSQPSPSKPPPANPHAGHVH